MNTYQSTPDFYRDYIQHFNKNHDPKNGQFASGHGGARKYVETTAKGNSERKAGNEKELKEWYKNAKEKPNDYLDKYEKEFKQTKRGKELSKKFSDAYDDYFYDDSNKEAEKRFNKAQDDLLRETQKYSVDKFFKNDAKKFTPQQMAYDQYPYGQRTKAVNEKDIKDYLLNEQWKLHRM